MTPLATCGIAVMAKAPRAGRSKTRLCPPLDFTDAAALSGAFLRDTTETIARAARSAPITAYAAYAPLGQEDLVRTHLAPDTRLLLADGSLPAPLGVRGFGLCLLQAVEMMLCLGHPAACVLSSDVPTLPERLLVEAARHLLAPGRRAVLGACDDGGYYLLGLQAPEARMFADIAWSTDSVADETRARAREIGLDLVELDPWYDIDDAAALGVLIQETGGSSAPATQAMIEQLGLRPKRPRALEGVPA